MRRSICKSCILAGVLVAMAWWSGVPQAIAGFSGFNNRSVGGVAIDAEGVVAAPTVQDQRELEQLRQTTALNVPAALEEFAELRAVSLKQIEATLARCAKEMKPLPEEVQYLAGLQRVQYVFIYPERQDIVLAGPAEGWKLDALGNVIGATTNRPVLLLDDLMTALRTGESSRTDPITCSIDPTPEGLKRLEALNRRLKTMGNREETLRLIEETLGPQVVSVTGVPTHSHFARTMVAADFRMKRLAMNFEPAPVDGMPSFLEMLASSRRGLQNAMPRWWMAPNYEPLAKTADGLAWELRGPGVKCLTAESFLSDSGEKQASDKANPIAEKWAATMTEKFEELSTHDSAFGQLRNVMDMAVVAALISKEGLLDVAKLEIPRLMGEQDLQRFPVPKQAASVASAIKQGNQWIISTSGGVEMLPWHIASEAETVEAVGEVRSQLTSDVQEFWWE